MKTGWVLCLKARLFFELCMYEDAAKVYEEVRTYEPLRLEGLEYYSSSLWQLQRETDLSALAGSLLEISQHHSVPWVTLANCFSANQEHNSAIKYFQRALQLDHESSYVYTLLAQEYFLVEDIENAQAAFRNALYVNPVDYRAW
jgi:anaphase-promoting complex subunit 3